MTKPPVNYDEEQRAVIAAPEKHVIGKAFAGAGKTTTAIGFTQARPDTRFLYLTFNRANAEEARKRFGPNVECKTAHAIAWAAVGRGLGDRVKAKWPARVLADELGVARVRIAAAAQSMLGVFFASADASMLPQHMQPVVESWKLDAVEQGHVMDVATRAWASMCDANATTVVPHDAYLKQYALQNRKLRTQHIILDEAQDTNPVTAQIVLAQKHASLLLLGDPYQSIYAFRGARNALAQFAEQGAKVYEMPRTWRFGQQTADMANAILSHFKGERTRIIGMGQDKPRKGDEPLAILSRTNAMLFGVAAKRRGRGIHWVGGIENYRIDLVLDAYKLFARRSGEIQDAVMRRYSSWAQFEEDVEAGRDSEGRMLVRMVNEYQNDIPSLIEELRANAVRTVEGAERILATAHKSKGLDFDYVLLAEDFECLEEAEEQMAKFGRVSRDMHQELNLLYVALTRARFAVRPNQITSDWLKGHP